MKPSQQEKSAAYFENRKAELKRLQADLASMPKAPYTLEIGCGHGHFLSALAQRNTTEDPQRMHLGLDIKSERISKAQTKSRRANLGNIRWLCCDVFDLLEYWPTDRQIAEIYVLFPDPWPRPRHHKNRFVNPKLLESLAKLTNTGALFHYRGDFDEYTEAIKEHIANSQSWDLELKDSFAQGLPPSVFEGHHPTYQTLSAKRH